MVKLYAFILWSGIAAFVFLSAAFVLGLTGWDFHWHKITAIIGYSFAVLHAASVLYKYLKVRAARRRAVHS